MEADGENFHSHRCENFTSRIHYKVLPVLNQASCHEDGCRNGGIAPSFLISALDGVCGRLHAPVALALGQTVPGTHCMGGWVGSRTGLDDMKWKIFCTCWELNLDSSVVELIARRYTSSYPGCTINCNTRFFFLRDMGNVLFEVGRKLKTKNRDNITSVRK
jgi:hypothetical protein